MTNEMEKLDNMLDEMQKLGTPTDEQLNALYSQGFSYFNRDSGSRDADYSGSWQMSRWLNSFVKRLTGLMSTK
jgi:hypothetical protein